MSKNGLIVYYHYDDSKWTKELESLHSHKSVTDVKFDYSTEF